MHSCRSASTNRATQQAIDSATADILFMIDDDAYMFPRCAERVLTVYENDPKATIAAVGPGFADRSPDAADAGRARLNWRWGVNWRARVIKFLAGYRDRFWPAGHPVDLADYHPQPHMPLRQCRGLLGGQITARRAVAAVHGFDEHMPGIFEDTDACLGFARQGAILALDEPLLFHAALPRQEGLDRGDALRRKQWILTHAYLCRKHAGAAPNLRAHCKQYVREMKRLDLLTGLITRDFSRWRGTRAGEEKLDRILDAPANEMGATLLRECQRRRVGGVCKAHHAH